MVMLKQIPDLESFEFVMDKLYEIVDESSSDEFDIHSVGETIGLSEDEIEAMNLHLRRSNIIEKAGGSLVRISTYGQMMRNGEINQGYVPISI